LGVNHQPARVSAACCQARQRLVTSRLPVPVLLSTFQLSRFARPWRRLASPAFATKQADPALPPFSLSSFGCRSIAHLSGLVKRFGQEFFEFLFFPLDRSPASRAPSTFPPRVKKNTHQRCFPVTVPVRGSIAHFSQAVKGDSPLCLSSVLAALVTGKNR
jgi:hypothetical protein